MSSTTESTPDAPVRILLVDDDLDQVRLVSKQLESHFDERTVIHTETSSENAEKACQDQSFDVIITDLDMDDVNGFHLLKKVKSREPYTQVIILTGHESGNALQSGLLLGVDDFFVKPVQMEELVSCIEYLLKRVNRWRSLSNSVSKI